MTHFDHTNMVVPPPACMFGVDEGSTPNYMLDHVTQPLTYDHPDLQVTNEVAYYEVNLNFDPNPDSWMTSTDPKLSTDMVMHNDTNTFTYTQDAEVTTTVRPGSKKKKDGVMTSHKLKGVRKRRKKSSYKHVPHAEKPAHLVEKRNARERKRVHAVNLAFVRLRKAMPFENKRGKRVSKVKILQRAITYIQDLHDMVNEHDGIVPDNFAKENMEYQDDSHLFAF